MFYMNMDLKLPSNYDAAILGERLKSEKVSSLNSGKRDISVLDFNILRNKNIDNIFCLICRFGQVISLRS